MILYLYSLYIYHVPDILRNQAPDVLKVDGRTEFVWSLWVNMVVPHTNLTEVSGMVFVKVDSKQM